MLFLHVKEQPGHFQHSLTREDVSPDGSAPSFPLPEFILSLTALPAAGMLGGKRSHKAILKVLFVEPSSSLKSQEPCVVWMPGVGRGALPCSRAE